MTLQELCLRWLRVTSPLGPNMLDVVTDMGLPPWLRDAIDPPTAVCDICGTEMFSCFLYLAAQKPPHSLHSLNIRYGFTACSSECLGELINQVSPD